MKSDYLLIVFDPVALALGPLQIHWYGIMYLLAFAAFWLLARRAVKRSSWLAWSQNDVDDFLFYGMLGVILGGRLGYALFYAIDRWIADPLFVFRVWDGGMSFHGGLMGVIVAMAWFGRKTGRSFWSVADFVAPLVPIGLAFGRLGNFIGGELWGRVAEVPWAMIFPAAVDPLALGGLSMEAAWKTGQLDAFARHPSQLYQVALEGIALFVIMQWFASRPRPAGATSGLFLLGYGTFRFLVEFFREPDAHIGFLSGAWFTMGMLLSLPMMIAGCVIMWLARNRSPDLEGS